MESPLHRYYMCVIYSDTNCFFILQTHARLRAYAIDGRRFCCCVCMFVYDLAWARTRVWRQTCKRTSTRTHTRARDSVSMCRGRGKLEFLVLIERARVRTRE